MDNLTNCFLAVIWPTNDANLEEIVYIIESEYAVTEVCKYVFDIAWDKMVRCIYQDDRTKEANLLSKINTMSGFSNYFYVVYIVVDKPFYRTKKDGRRISTKMEELKKKLRNKFGGKKSPNNPLHIVDEQKHSVSMYNRLKVCGEFVKDDRCEKLSEPNW